MKKIHAFLTILLVSITITSFAQNTNTSEGIRFENLTFNKALEKAKQTNKIIFIDCYTTWCGPCKYMEKNIFSLKEAGEYFNTKFINLKIDMMQEEGKKISSKYPVKGYPTFLFIDGDGKEVARVMGSTNTFAEFKSKIEEVLNSDNSLESLKNNYSKDKNRYNAEAYMNYLYNNKLYDNFVNVFKDASVLYDVYDLFSEDMWKFTRVAFYSDKETYEFVLKNKHIADICIGKDKINEEFKEFYKAILLSYLTNEEQTISPDKIIEIVNYISFVIPTEDNYTSLIASIARAKAESKNDDIINLFTYGNLRELNVDNQIEIETILSSFDFIPAEKWQKYYESKSQISKNMTDYSIEYTKQIVTKKGINNQK